MFVPGLALQWETHYYLVKNLKQWLYSAIRNHGGRCSTHLLSNYDTKVSEINHGLSGKGHFVSNFIEVVGTSRSSNQTCISYLLRSAVDLVPVTAHTSLWVEKESAARLVTRPILFRRLILSFCCWHCECECVEVLPPSHSQPFKLFAPWHSYIVLPDAPILPLRNLR